MVFEGIELGLIFIPKELNFSLFVSAGISSLAFVDFYVGVYSCTRHEIFLFGGLGYTPSLHLLPPQFSSGGTRGTAKIWCFGPSKTRR